MILTSYLRGITANQSRAVKTEAQSSEQARLKLPQTLCLPVTLPWWSNDSANRDCVLPRTSGPAQINFFSFL